MIASGHHELIENASLLWARSLLVSSPDRGGDLFPCTHAEPLLHDVEFPTSKAGSKLHGATASSGNKSGESMRSTTTTILAGSEFVAQRSSMRQGRFCESTCGCLLLGRQLCLRSTQALQLADTTLGFGSRKFIPTPRQLRFVFYESKVTKFRFNGK